MFATPRSFIAVLALSACAVGPTEPGPTDGPLRLEAAIGRASLAVGDTTDLVFRLVNTGSRPVTINFSTSCQVLPYIRTADAGVLVYPASGGWGCFQALTALTVPGNGEHVVRVMLRGGAPQVAIHTGTPIGQGHYVATAEVMSHEYQLRSDPVAFQVR